ncbi:MAG: hypothetical protein WCZ86_13370, partial [Desulfurivibrionaceae bacterium]
AAKKEAENRTTKPGSQLGSGEKINPPSFGEPFEIEFFYRLVRSQKEIMLKKFLNGIIFGAGFAISFLAIWFITMYFIAPKILSDKIEKIENPNSSVTSAPPLTEKKRFLGSPGAYSTDFKRDRSKVLSSGPGEIKGKILLNGNPLKGLKLRLALNGTVMSQWAVSGSSGEYIINVPYGKYRIDGYEFDSSEANNVLAGKIDHPQNPHSSPTQDVNSQRKGLGLNFRFMDPVIKKTKGEYSASEEIILEWEPYPNASKYSVQLFEKTDPNVWSNKAVFPHSQTPSVSESKINLTVRNIALTPNHFYVLQIYAKDENGETLSESPTDYNGYDFIVNQ